MEKIGQDYIQLFYRDYVKEFFPINKNPRNLIHFFVKKVVYHKFLKLGIYEWKKNN